MKYIKHIFCLLILSLVLSPAMAADQEKENVDLEEILMGRTRDSYEWHITDFMDKPIVLHLPIIVRSSTGWHVFYSNEFAHGPNEQGNRPGPYGLYIANNEVHENKICEMVNGEEVRPFGISITKTVAVLFINAIILLLCTPIPPRWCCNHKPSDPAPGGFVGMVHMFVVSVYDGVIKPTLGKEADKYAPYLLTCFFFVLISNFMGVIPFPPGGGNLAGNITCTFFLALCAFLIANLTGTKAYWKEIFWPDVPLWVKAPIPLIPFIELFGILTKPLASTIRLFANMMAGHAITMSFACTIFIMFAINPVLGTSMTVVSILMSVLVMLLELLVCYIQALVFTMLSAIFISLTHVEGHSASIE